MEFLQPIIAAIYFVFGAIFLFLAYMIFRDNPSQRINRVTSLMLFFAAMGPIFLALGTIIKPNAEATAPFEESIVYNLKYVWEFFFPAFLLFAMVFPVDRFPTARRSRLRYFIFLPYIFHMFLAIVFHDPERVLDLLEVQPGGGLGSMIMEPLSQFLKYIVLGFSLILGSEETLFSILNLVYVILAVYLMVRGRTMITNRILRNQTFILVLGVSVAVGCYAAAFLLPSIMAYEISDSLRTLLIIGALLTGGGAVVWSVIRHQFLDVQVIVRQSLVYTISSGLLVGLYVLFIGQADQWITSIMGQKTTIINIAFIITALLLFQPINVQLDNLIKRLFIRTGSDYRHVMEDLTRNLISIFDPAQLRAMIEKTLKSTLLVEQLYFTLYDDKLGEYVLLPSDDQPDSVIIEREDLLLGGINQLDSPSSFRSLSLYHEGSRLAAELEKRRVVFILPLKDADHLLGFLALAKKISGYKYNVEDITMLGVISNQLVSVLTNARLYADSLEKRRMDEEMKMAREIQMDLIPKHPPQGENFEIRTYWQPSREIGGDFFDFIDLRDGRFALIIADAAGKGMPAALMVAQTQAIIRAEVNNSEDIRQVLFNVNNHLSETTAAGKYATLFLGIFDQKSCTFQYVNAGHNNPLLVHEDGSLEYLTEGGIIIGAFTGTTYQHNTIRLVKDDVLVFYTDGLSEAMNESEEEYGESRIADYTIKNRHRNPGDIMNNLIDDVKNFDSSEPPRDDTTIIVLKVCQDINHE